MELKVGDVIAYKHNPSRHLKIIQFIDDDFMEIEDLKTPPELSFSELSLSKYYRWIVEITLDKLILVKSTDPNARFQFHKDRVEKRHLNHV